MVPENHVRARLMDKDKDANLVFIAKRTEDGGLGLQEVGRELDLEARGRCSDACRCRKTDSRAAVDRPGG
jgi:hypothetical protein